MLWALGVYEGWTLICTGKCTDITTRSEPARRGYSRAILSALVVALGAFAGETAWAVDATSAKIDPTRDSSTDHYYKVGNDIPIEVEFGGVVYVQEHPEDGVLELILDIGQHSRRATYIDGSGNADKKLHFRYTVQSGDYDSDGISIAHGSDSLVGGNLVDSTSSGTAVGRGFPAVAASSSRMVDGIAPQVDRVSITRRDDGLDTHGLGDEIEVTVTFDEVVHVDETISELFLILSVGDHSRRAAFAGGSGTATLQFSYTVQRGDQDEDGISIGAGPGALQGAGVTDSAGNLVDRTFPAKNKQDKHKVDGVNPVLDAVDIVTPDGHDDIGDIYYGLNDKITVTVNFGEEVHVTETDGDNLVLILSIGANSRSARLVDGSGTTTLRFSYVVQINDYDKDGVTIGPTALRGGVIEDGGGNEADRTFAGVGAPNPHKVDGISPSLRGMQIVSRPDGAKYGLNEKIMVEVVFDEEVHVDETESELLLTLAIGQHSRQATFIEGSGTRTLLFSYVVQSGDYDVDGISIGPGPGALKGARVVDRAHNSADRLFVGLAANRLHRVDGVRPSMKRVSITSRPDANDTYGLNEEISVEVDFGEVVFVDETNSELVLVLSIGQHSRRAAYVDGSGTDTLAFGYVVQVDDRDADGISIGANALRGGAIEDAGGNTVDRTSAGVAASERHKVDGADSPLARLRFRIVPPDGHDGIYGLNEEIHVAVDFPAEVHASGELRLFVTIGEHSRPATLVDGSGTETLTFRYVVQSGDQDDDGISIGPNALQGGALENAVGNPVDRVFAGLSADGDHLVDGVSPSLTEVQIVEAADHDGIYGLNEEIRVAVDFGEEVHVTGEVSLVLSIGEHLRVADLVSGSGTDTLIFRYVVQSGDSDADGISIGPNALQGDGIEDVAGNAVVLGFDGLSADDNHKVDSIGPELTDVRIVVPPGHDDVYGLDEAILVEALFSEAVHVTVGEADLSIMLSIGQHLRPATFVRGSGTKTLTFRYVVQSGDSDDDGISIGPNALQGGTIEDSAGNGVARAFSGLPANDRHMVRTVAAVVPAVEDVVFASDAGSNDTYTTGDEIRLHVVFNVLVYVRGDSPVLKLSVGSMERDAVFQEGSGTRTLEFQYTVEAGDTDDDGISIGPNALIGNIEDEGGNTVDLTLPALGAQPEHMVSAELMLYPLSLTLLVGQAETINLSGQLKDLGVDYDGHFGAISDDDGIATADVDASGRMLTITSVTEGAATITAKAVDAAIYLIFGVTVETSPEETAVLEGALAAVGRGMIASAASTIGARLESTDSDSTDQWGARGLAPNPVAGEPQRPAMDGIDNRGSIFDPGYWGVDDPYLERSMGYTLAQWLRGARFEMPFGSFGNPITSLSVWGAGDWHAFEGEPESGLYDGSLTSIYLGIDAKGNGWISGAAVSHAIADASYEYGGVVGGKGRLETELNVIHPYLQWAFGDRGKVWAILGLGAGEATAEREGQEASTSSSDLSMLMGLSGMRYAFGPWAGFDFAVRGDAGFAKLETDEGPRAIQGLTVNVHRARMGVEASLPMALAGIPVSPFIDVAGRYDGGDGANGGGVELAGGFRYRGSMVGFEVKGRTLAMHSDESYSEQGVKATLALGPNGRRGFRLMLAPKWGGTAEAMDIFTYRGHPFAGALRRENRGWGLGTRISYGFDMRRRPGTIVPYWELDLSRDAYRQARLGVSYELASAFAGMPHRLEISGESTESDQHGSIMRFLLSGQAHF